MSETEIELPSIVWSGDGFNCIEMTRDGGGEFPNGYRLTPEGVRRVARWMREHVDVSDVEECPACAVIEKDYCPIHYGIGLGQQSAIEAAAAAVKGILR